MKYKISIFLFLMLISFSRVNNALANLTGNGSGVPVQLNNPLTGNTSSKSIPDFLGTIINYVMGIIGSLALVMFIYGGAIWMLSRGSSEKVEEGKKIIIWSALGIGIIFMSYAVVKFVIMAFGNAAS